MQQQVTYCEVTDLIFGNIPVPANAQKFVSQASDEMDSQIGLRYATPVVTSGSTEQRPTQLLLKRVAIFLATGRCILAVGSAGEDNGVHQYGLYLIQQAEKVLKEIVDGKVILPGVELSTSTPNKSSGPLIAQVDNASAVEAFVDVFGNPASNSITRPRADPRLGVYPYPSYRG